MGAYTTVGTVCASSLFRCLIDLDVLYNEVTGVKALGVCIRLCILEETEKEFGGLDRPPCSRDSELLAYLESDLSQNKQLPP